MHAPDAPCLARAALPCQRAQQPAKCTSHATYFYPPTVDTCSTYSPIRSRPMPAAYSTTSVAGRAGQDRAPRGGAGRQVSTAGRHMSEAAGVAAGTAGSPTPASAGSAPRPRKTSPRASASVLPCSRVMEAASSSVCRTISSCARERHSAGLEAGAPHGCSPQHQATCRRPEGLTPACATTPPRRACSLNMTRARCGTGVARHLTNASLPDATAALNSSGVHSGRRDTTSCGGHGDHAPGMCAAARLRPTSHPNHAPAATGPAEGWHVHG